MQSGKLKHLIEIERKTETKDADIGESVFAWSRVIRAWASMEPLSARELIRVREFSSEITTRFEIRYVGGLDNTMRIKYFGYANLLDTNGERLLDTNGLPLLTTDIQYYSISEIIQPVKDRRSLVLLAFAEQPVT